MSSFILGALLISVSIFRDVRAALVVLTLFLLYLKMSFCLVYPLMAEKKVSALLALKLSFKLVNKNISQFTLLLVMYCLLVIFALLTSGLGLFLIIPFYVNMMGIIYRQICGVTISVTEVSVDENNHHGPHSGGFEA